MQELEKILEEIRKAFEENTEYIMDEDGYHHFVIDVCTAKYSVNQIIRKHMNDSWIPVEDRLPEENIGTVWGTVKNRCGKYITVRLNWAYGKFTFMSGLPVENDDCMIAWKPYYVPGPYRLEESEEE